MGSLLQTKNGVRTVCSQEDLYDIVDEMCGEEVSSYIRNNFETSVDRIFQNPDLVDEILERTDYFSYESSLDEHNSTFCEIRDITDDMMVYLQDAKKLDRNKLYEWARKLNEQAVLSL
jgi:hypothetical protein